MTEYEKMVQEAQAKRINITKAQQKKIKKMYTEISKDLENRIKTANKGTLTERWLKDFQKQFEKQIKTLNETLKSDIKDSMGKSAEIPKGLQLGFFNTVDEKYSIDSSAHFSNMFTNIPQDAVNELVNGKFYKDGKGLNKRIWSNQQKANADFDYILQKGLAEKKSVYDLANDLAKYVNPEAKKDWAFKKLYPNVGNKTVDYNAVRLAITSTSHAYQLSMQRSCKANPYVEGIEWHTSNSHREPCGLCQSREGQIYSPDKLPLDHPMGVCYFTPVIPKSLEDIGTELGNWLKGEKNGMLDQHMKDNTPVGSTKKETSVKKEKPSLRDRLLDFGYYFEDKEWKSIYKSIEGAPEFMQDWIVKHQNDLKFETVEATKEQGAFYSPKTKSITMNIDRDGENTRGKYSTFFHEFGHLLDHSCREIVKVDGRWTFSNYPSADSRFINAIKEDYQDMLNSPLLKGKPEPFINGKLTELLRKEGDLSSGVQDAYSGLTLNKVRPNWGHATEYWTRKDADKEIASETFANMTSAYNNPEILKIMQKWFPKACSSFEEIVKEIVARE